MESALERGCALQQSLLIVRNLEKGLSMFSLIRGLTASISSNVSALKRQAKRLQKASPEIFGHQITIEQAQEAVARANGFYHWAEINELSVKAGADRSTPFWHVFGRNDLHGKILDALVCAEVDLNENGPIVLLGEPCEAALPATCLFAEMISARKEPGLILIETDQPTLQETAVGSSISLLGLDESFSHFRVIDAREKTLPVAISATPEVWARSIVDLLSKKDRDKFELSGAWHLFEQFIIASGVVSHWYTESQQILSFGIVENAARYLRNFDLAKYNLVDMLKGDFKTSVELDIQACTSRGGVPPDALQHVIEIVEAFSERKTELGPVLWSESERRPTVVLFNRKDAVSEVLASAVHEMFYWRYVPQRAIRPILYVSDTGTRSIPPMLNFGSETIIVNGSDSKTAEEWEEVTMGHAMFGTVAHGFLTYSGRKVDISL